MSRVKIVGLVDPHVHLRGLDWSHKATFASETAAAIAGGYWAVMDMPNTSPSTINQAALNRKLDEISSQALCDWGIYFGASRNDNSAEFRGAYRHVCGLKMYNNDTTGDLLVDDQTIREQLFRTWESPKPIAVHAEEETVLDILALVRKYHKATHFCHISTAAEIRYLREAKMSGLPVTIGVTPHHLYLTQDDLPTLGSLGLMKPELKTKSDQAALWQAVQNGIVDVIESDHAPHSLAEKSSSKPPYGVPGLETALPLLGLAIHEGRLTFEQLVDLVSINPCRIFGLIIPDDTYTIIDFDFAYTIDRHQLFTKCGWSPFDGMRVFGKVVEVWIRGYQVYDGEQILVPPSFGLNIATFAQSSDSL